MTKRHVRELFQIASHIIQDAKAFYPDLGAEFDRDQARLAQIVDNRGLHAFCVDLPAISKHLERCLESGTYCAPHLPFSGSVSRAVTVPKFLRGLFLRIFDESGKLREDDADVNLACFLTRQICLVGKRTTVDCPEGNVRQEVGRFLRDDSILERPGSAWGSSDAPNDFDPRGGGHFVATPEWRQVIGDCEDARFERLRPVWKDSPRACRVLLHNLQSIADYVAVTLGSYDPSEWRFRHGPGVTSRCGRFSNKYKLFENWGPRLEKVFPCADYAWHNYAAWASDIGAKADEIPPWPDADGSKDPPWSRLISVPKTFQKPRLIAAEPLEHMWCQQNVWHYFRSRVERTWISKFVSFGDQTKNQELALKGSKDGSLATLDLSSASDRVSCWAVECFFRANPSLLGALMATRTTHLAIDRELIPDDLQEAGFTIDGRQRGLRNLWGPGACTALRSSSPDVRARYVLELFKFSTMGSAVTFPVETLLFLGVSLAACMTARQQRFSPALLQQYAEEVVVYGDDIVVPCDCREAVIAALEYLYFQVNTNKSFWNGKFRESCGVDAYAGYDITPTYYRGYYDGKPESLARSAELANHFYKKGLWRTAAYVESTIRSAGLPLVPVGSGALGLESFVKPGTANSSKRRWNPKLQRFERYVPVITTETTRQRTDGHSMMLQYFTERPHPLTKWMAGTSSRPRLRVKKRWVSEDTLR